MLNNGFLEALARECGHNTSYKHDEFVEFEDMFNRWHSHVLVREYRWHKTGEHPFCYVRNICVYDNLNTMAKFARSWVYDNTISLVDKDNKGVQDIKDYVSVDFLGGDEFHIYIRDNDTSFSKNLKITFIDFNNPSPVDTMTGDKWDLKTTISS